MSANQMLENISRIDIGILDISMEELNGIKLGEKIERKISRCEISVYYEL